MEGCIELKRTLGDNYYLFFSYFHPLNFYISDNVANIERDEKEKENKKMINFILFSELINDVLLVLSVSHEMSDDNNNLAINNVEQSHHNFAIN